MPEPASVVYVVGSPGSPVVKIGTTTQLAQRTKDLRTMSAAPIEVLGYLPGGRLEEAALHQHFAALRTHGEWFDLGDSDPLSTIQAALDEDFQSPVQITGPDCSGCGHPRERHSTNGCNVAGSDEWLDCRCGRYTRTSHGTLDRSTERGNV